MQQKQQIFWKSVAGLFFIYIFVENLTYGAMRSSGLIKTKL